MGKCCQCNRPFVPNPRVADRQVTCGDAQCRRRQHAESCRRWREQHRDVTAHHYEDAVIPFRNSRRTYQREWRFLRSLREIRDAIVLTLLVIRGPLGRLITRGECTQAAREKESQKARFGEQDWFADALRIACRISLLLDELASLVQQLEGMDER
jgi:hypothetical protein